MTALHRGDDNGLVGLQTALDALPRTWTGPSARATTKHGKVLAQDVLHDWSVHGRARRLCSTRATALDGPLSRRNFSTKTLHATINWANPNTYDTPGAPSNGADYVQLRNAGGRTGRRQGHRLARLQRLEDAADAVRCSGPSTRTHRSLHGNPALYSGADDDRDEAIVKPRVGRRPGRPRRSRSTHSGTRRRAGTTASPRSRPTVVRRTRASRAPTRRSQPDPDALPTAVENVPGFTGSLGAFKPETCDLSAYAGQTVLLAFRAFNDPATLGTDRAIRPGFWVDNVKVGTTSISDGSSLDGWKSFTETKPNTVAGFTVRIVSINSKRKTISVRTLRLNSSFTLRGQGVVWPYIDRNADFVGAIVFYDDPSERSTQYAPYTLTVNGVTQPGGS